MRSRLRRGFVVGIVFGAAACFANWLLEGETSPFYKYFLFHLELPNLWGRFNFVPYVVVLILGRGPYADAIYYASMFVQWAIVSLLVSLLVPVRNGRFSKAA